MKSQDHELARNRVAHITRSRRGIGRAHAIAFAQAGVRVAVADLPSSGNLQLSPARLVVDEIRAMGGKAEAIDVNLNSIAAGHTAVMIAQDLFGAPVDILINNAGISGSATMENESDEELDLLYGIHVHSYLGTMQAVLGSMMDRKFGRIINTVSEVAFGSPMSTGGGVSYGAAKAAVWSMTLNVAQQVINTGVTVNGISPGAFTAMSASVLQSNKEAESLLDPKYVAEVAVWLSSDEAGDVNGKVVHVAGKNVREYTGMKRTNGTPLVQRITTACDF